MISTDANDLSKEKIQQLLAAIGSEPTEDATQIETAEYNWHQPYYFGGEQLKTLDNFIEKVAAATAEKFATLAHSNFNVTIVSTTQQYANELLNQLPESEKGDYYLGFGTDHDHPCGFISITPQTAIVLTTQLLGDSDSSDESESEKSPDRDLSQLEESLLLDIASALVEAFSASCDNYTLHPAKGLLQGQWPLELQGTEEMCKIVFGIKKDQSGDSLELGLLIPCCEIERAAGITAQTAGKFSAEDISEAILQHIQQVPVRVTVQLASTILSFKEIMNLQIDDILILDKKIDEPVELIVDGRTVCRGRPAKSAGEYAMVITEPLCDTSRNIRPT